MLNLSRSQLNYIAAIDALKVIGATQTTISDFLDVKRPSVHAAIKILMNKGYVEVLKREDKTITYGLTESGLNALAHLRREQQVYFSFFCDFIGMDEETVKESYDKCPDVMDTFMLENLAEFCNNGFQKINRTKEENAKRSAYGQYKNGKYSIPFQVHKYDGSSPSMGDKGFEHPATIIIDDLEKNLYLKAKTIYYKPGTRRGVHGTLLNLSYYKGGEWHPAEVINENTYVIPLKHIPCISNEIGKLETGQIKIQAESSCKHMPVSIADIILNFNAMKPIREDED